MKAPASGARLLAAGLALLLLLYCATMDALLLVRVTQYRLDQFNSSEQLPRYADAAWLPCAVNPLCEPTVKALLVDHVNHFVYGPLSAALELWAHVSRYVPPDVISGVHVAVAIVGARLLAGGAAGARWAGALLFQLRMFLDDLDGTVARARAGVRGEHSSVGSSGYWVDGLCDLLGVLALLVAVLVRERAPRRSLRGRHYRPLGVSGEEGGGGGRGAVRELALFAGQMLVASLAWNRYIAEYQRLLEECSDAEGRREEVFRSRALWAWAGGWRLLNPHVLLQLLTLAAALDRAAPLLRLAPRLGYVVLAALVVASEALLYHHRQYVGACG